MPTYEYACTKCDHLYEKFQPMTAERDKECPKCGGPVKRLIGAGAGIIMKGSAAQAACPASSACQAETPCCGGNVPCPKFS